ncbi:hypothetical protein [Streptomyces sp. x-80]|uniref:hypothetical protein n=1 Tax=Streptomyces sp. x-80 TaxID=2789282 RepID=UPI0039800A4D
MLSLATPATRRTTTKPALAFRCETTATALGRGARSVILATYRAGTPRLAARWLWSQAEHLADLLDPTPAAPQIQDAPLLLVAAAAPHPAGDLRAWARDATEYERSLRALAAGDAFLLSVIDYDARYSITAYPLPADRRSPQTPAPAGCQSPSPAGAGRHRRAAP